MTIEYHPKASEGGGGVVAQERRDDERARSAAFRRRGCPSGRTANPLSADGRFVLVPTEELNRFRLEEVATGKLDTDVRLVGNWMTGRRSGRPPATSCMRRRPSTATTYTLKGLLTGNDTVLHHFDTPEPTIAPGYLQLSADPQAACLHPAFPPGRH